MQRCSSSGLALTASLAYKSVDAPRMGCVGSAMVSAARNAGTNSSMTCVVSAAFNASDNVLRWLLLVIDSTSGASATRLR